MDRGAAEGWSLVARATLTLGDPIGFFLPVERSPGERSAAGAKTVHSQTDDHKHSRCVWVFVNPCHDKVRRR